MQAVQESSPWGKQIEEEVNSEVLRSRMTQAGTGKQSAGGWQVRTGQQRVSQILQKSWNLKETGNRLGEANLVQRARETHFPEASPVFLQGQGPMEWLPVAAQFQAPQSLGWEGVFKNPGGITAL